MGRVDTLMAYDDATWEKMKRSGAKMIFMGAESGDDETLKRMNKGGKSGTAMTLALVERMKHYGIVPELSFVLGNPPDPAADIEFDHPLHPQDQADQPGDRAGALHLHARAAGRQHSAGRSDQARLQIPRYARRVGGRRVVEVLDAARPRHTPWFKDDVRRRVRNFEQVVNAYYPTVTDLRMKGNYRHALKALSGWRYKLKFYDWPYELKALQRVVHYRRPETTGF